MICVVGAFYQEVKGVVDLLTSKKRKKLASGGTLFLGDIHSTQESGVSEPNSLPTPWAVGVLGMGVNKVKANMLDLLTHMPEVSHILVVGVSGGFSPLVIGDVVIPDRVIWEESLFLLQSIPNRIAKHTESIPVVGGDLYTSDCVVEQSLGVLLKKEYPNLLMVDMESGVIASIAQSRGIPCSVLRIISDLVDNPQNSREQWQQQGRRVLETLQTLLKTLCTDN